VATKVHRGTGGPGEDDGRSRRGAKGTLKNVREIDDEEDEARFYDT